MFGGAGLVGVGVRDLLGLDEGDVGVGQGVGVGDALVQTLILHPRPERLEAAPGPLAAAPERGPRDEVVLLHVSAVGHVGLLVAFHHVARELVGRAGG